MYPSENIQSCHTEHCKRQLVQNTYIAWASKNINHSKLYLGKTIRLFLPSVFTAVTKELYHVGKKESPDFHQLRTRRGVLQESGHHLQNHWVEDNISHEEGKMEARDGSRVGLNNARMRGWNCGVFTYWGSGSWQWSQAPGGACEPPAYRPALSESAQMGWD